MNSAGRDRSRRSRARQRSASLATARQGFVTPTMQTHISIISNDIANYCGPVPSDETALAVGRFVIDEMLHGGSNGDFAALLEDMTEAEVAAIPDAE